MVPPGDNSYSLFPALVKQEKIDLYGTNDRIKSNPPKNHITCINYLS